jgi:hypothetical protein
VRQVGCQLPSGYFSEHEYEYDNTVRRDKQGMIDSRAADDLPEEEDSEWEDMA